MSKVLAKKHTHGDVFLGTALCIYIVDQQHVMDPDENRKEEGEDCESSWALCQIIREHLA